MTPIDEHIKDELIEYFDNTKIPEVRVPYKPGQTIVNLRLTAKSFIQIIKNYDDDSNMFENAKQVLIWIKSYVEKDYNADTAIIAEEQAETETPAKPQIKPVRECTPAPVSSKPKKKQKPKTAPKTDENQGGLFM